LSRKRLVTGVCGLAVAIAVIAIGAGQVATGADTNGAVVGNLTAAAADTVNLQAAPTGFAPSAPSRPAMIRGAAVPAGPSTGSKPGAKASTAVTPFVVTTNSFNGIDLVNANCGCQPPDVNATVGGPYVVETVNLEYAVYNKANGALLFSISMNNFFATADGLSDPRVLYDPTWNRWAVSITDTSGPSLWFAYSVSGDPTDGFYKYHVGFPLPAGSIVDYPNTGQDRNVFAYTSNNFDASNNYINSTAFVVPKALVYNGFGWGAVLYGVNYDTTPSIVGGHPTQATNFLYLLSPDDGANLMRVYHFSNTGGVPSFAVDPAITYNWAAPPRRVNQPGTSQTLDPLDGRIDWAATQLDGRVWFAHGVDVAGFPSVNYGFVNPSSGSIHTATAFETASSDDFNPSISVENSSGTPQEWVTWAYTDTPHGIPTRDVYALNQGTTLNHLTGTQYGPNGNSTNEFRFGDYSSSWPEYNAVGSCAEGLNAVVANQYFKSDGTWATRIARVHRSGC
jgi:hypothetical protein